MNDLSLSLTPCTDFPFSGGSKEAEADAKKKAKKKKKKKKDIDALDAALASMKK